MGDPNIRDKPKTKAGDVAHTLAKAGLSAIPVVGGPAAELLSAIIVPPLARRRDEWIKSIAKGLKVLEEKVDGFKIEDLSQNETFITIVMQASQAAIRNHQKEKHEALRNAVLNSALPNAPEEDAQLMFLSFVDSLTRSHLTVLKFFDDADAQWRKQPYDELLMLELEGKAKKDGVVLLASWDRVLRALKRAFPDRDSSLHDQVIEDLYARGLLDTGSLSEGSLYNPSDPSTTDIGKRFINFITSPIENDDERK